MKVTTQAERTQLQKKLSFFTETMAYHKFSPLSNLKLTDGAKFLCDEAGAFWLMDIVASYQPQCMKDETLKDFQIWELEVDTIKNTGTVQCLRDTDDIAIEQEIPFTDFPLEHIKLYCINGVVLLTSEY